jgi:hypothetical protein
VHFVHVIAIWYGSQWRRIAPLALGVSRRTLGRWCADDSRVPRWAWFRFATDRVIEKQHTIDRAAKEQHALIDEAAAHQKSAVLITSRLVDDRLRRTEFEPPPRRGRRRKMAELQRPSGSPNQGATANPLPSAEDRS